MSNHQHQLKGPFNASWLWAGIHRPPDPSHPFFSARHDPQRLYPGVQCQNIIFASSGGLLLIHPSPHPVRFTGAGEFFHVSLTLEAQLHSMALSRAQTSAPSSSRTLITPDAERGDVDQPSPEHNQRWKTLLVVNPATREYRKLPPANSMDVGLESWDYDATPQANLLADTEAQAYTVTLTFIDCVCLYTSTSNKWQCRRFNQGALWYALGPIMPDQIHTRWESDLASTYFQGRLLIADFDEGNPVHTMSLVEIDAGRGDWKLHNWNYLLQTHFTDFSDIPFRRMRGLTDHGRQARPLGASCRCRPGRYLENFEIVECMGELYAVIPMSLSENLPQSMRSQATLAEVVHEYGNYGLSFMPLQFVIVSMRGDGFVHGVLRIVVPKEDGVAAEHETYHQRIRRELVDLVGEEPFERFPGRKWVFSCFAEGSVIWVEVNDFVLQYDVVTGVSKTQVIWMFSPEEVVATRVYYRPSAMKP